MSLVGRLGGIIDLVVADRAHSRYPFIASVWDCELGVEYHYEIMRGPHHILLTVHDDSAQLNKVRLHDVAGTWKYCTTKFAAMPEEGLRFILHDMELLFVNENYHR